jgi:hypothetical protein
VQVVGLHTLIRSSTISEEPAAAAVNNGVTSSSVVAFGWRPNHDNNHKRT